MTSLRSRLEQRLLHSWYEKASPNPLLRPLGWCYGKVASARRNKGLERARRNHMAEPILVVGNITAGGSGKSPLLAALARELLAQDYQIGVLMRGYGGRHAEYPHRVGPDDDPLVVGDEALMLKQMLDCPLVVDPDRVRGARKLIQEDAPALILSDDGLQHYNLPRDMEIAVIDAERGLGNGLLLPAGPLREPVERLDSVDLCLCNGDPDLLPAELRRRIHYSFRLRPSAWRHLASGQSYAIDARPFAEEVHAVTGIGNPQRFLRTLDGLGLAVTPHLWSDHHSFRPVDFPADGRPVVMTAKDGVKCRGFAADHWWVLEVEAELPNDLRQEFLHRCETLIGQAAE